MRYLDTGLEKDWKAYKNAEDCYEANITELMTGGLATYEITSMDYDLYRIVCDLTAGYLEESEG